MPSLPNTPPPTLQQRLERKTERLEQRVGMLEIQLATNPMLPLRTHLKQMGLQLQLILLTRVSSLLFRPK